MRTVVNTVIATVAFVAIVVYVAVKMTLRRFRPTPLDTFIARRRRDGREVKTVLVVLGSGGHTSEMFRMLTTIPAGVWHNIHPIYLVSETDKHSAKLAQLFEQSRLQRRADVRYIARAREVGQSFLFSIPSIMRALVESFKVFGGEHIDVILVDGPGVCVPPVFCALLYPRIIPWKIYRPLVFYAESFTCVKHLSVTGQIMCYMADAVAVHWYTLYDVVARKHIKGSLYYIGFEKDDVGQVSLAAKRSNPLSVHDSSANNGLYAIVTVGSTRFEPLVRTMAQTSVCEMLNRRFGITKLYIQYGTMHLNLKMRNDLADNDVQGDICEWGDEVQHQSWAGVEVEAFAYRSDLARRFGSAALVVTHGGAGTVLECMEARCPTIVVPNRDLYMDHQLELAEALAARDYLICSSVETLVYDLASKDFSRLKCFPGLNVSTVRQLLCTILTGKESVAVFTKRGLGIQTCDDGSRQAPSV